MRSRLNSCNLCAQRKNAGFVGCLLAVVCLLQVLLSSPPRHFANAALSGRQSLAHRRSPLFDKGLYAIGLNVGWQSDRRRSGFGPTALAAKGEPTHSEEGYEPQGYKPVKPLHIVSYNIKGFGVGFDALKKNPDEVARCYDGIRRDIARLQPDIVSMNEVLRFPFVDSDGNKRADSLEALAEDLGDMQVRFAHATPGFERFGNAVLVHPDLKILGNASVHLNGGSIVKTKDGREKRIVRSALAVHLKVAEPRALDPLNPVPPPGLSIVSTHWDHISDQERCRQSSGLVYLRDELTAGLPHVILGDLNAIKKTDYGAGEWQAIASRNAKMGWKEPCDCDSVRYLERAGYQDLMERSLGGPGGVAKAPSEYKLTASTDDPLVRIDYAYLSEDLVQSLERCTKGPPGMPAKPFPARCFVDRSATGSDHFPICLELARR